ncbi:MAG: class I SAM-dependent methyltransferase [Candidatus Paceibacterota bacterium]
MKYKKDFHFFQNEYTKKYPAANTMRKILLNTVSLDNKRVLDVGCGSGIDLDYFHKNGAIIHGLDISSELINITKNRFTKADILEGNFNYLPWKNNYFDIVWSKYALQHDKNISVSLNEIYRVLKKKSKAFIQFTHPMRSVNYVNSKNYFQKGELINYPTVDKKIINEYHHTMTEWIQTILETGFKIVYFEEILNRPIKEYSSPISPSALILILEKT